MGEREIGGEGDWGMGRLGDGEIGGWGDWERVTEDTALPCPDFGNIHNSDATGLEIKGDRTAAKLSTTKTFVKFCNKLLGKSSLSAIGQETEPNHLHSLAVLENESNPCGAHFSPVQRCQLNT